MLVTKARTLRLRQQHEAFAEFLSRWAKRAFRSLKQEPHFCNCVHPQFELVCNAKREPAIEPRRCDRCGHFRQDGNYAGACRRPTISAAIEAMREWYRSAHKQTPPKPLTPSAGEYGPIEIWTEKAIDEAVADFGRHHRDDGEGCASFKRNS